ncbi:MAG: hypothetical protein H6834_18560 [Planctomycetes bacterium]|nr:hypothetical protein [Planctomycetota bacterium]
MKRLAEVLGGLVGLVTSQVTTSYGLTWMDHHLERSRQKDPAPVDGDRWRRWREIADDLLEAFPRVRDLWRSDVGGIDTAGRFDFGRIGQGEVSCGPLHDITYHGLVISIVSLLLEPESLGRNGGVIRIRTMEALPDPLLSGRLFLYLDQEYVRLVGLSPLVGEQETAPHPSAGPRVTTTERSSKPSRPPGIPAGYRLLVDEHPKARDSEHEAIGESLSLVLHPGGTGGSGSPLGLFRCVEEDAGWTAERRACRRS